MRHSDDQRLALGAVGVGGARSDGALRSIVFAAVATATLVHLT